MLQRSNEGNGSRFSEHPPGQEVPGTQDDRRVDSPATLSSDGGAAPVDSPAAPRPGNDVNLGIGPSVRTATQHGRGQAETLISERSSFEGVFRTDEPIRVRGTMQGEVESKSSVIIEEQGRVTATVTAAAVTVAGQVDGKIVCTERAELTSTAHVRGEIIAPTVIVREGAYFEGDLKMGTSIEQTSPVEVATRRGR